MIDHTHTLVSEATQERLAHALFELRVATSEYYEAWLSYCREAYATGEMASAKAEEQEQ